MSTVKASRIDDICRSVRPAKETAQYDWEVDKQRYIELLES